MSSRVFKSRYYWAVVVAAIVALGVFVYNCKGEKRFVCNGSIWKTDYHISYTATKNMNDSIVAILDAVDKSASVYNKQSVITALNENRSDVADGYIMKMMAASADVHKRSGGAYDPTVMPLVNAWGFGYKSGQLPGQEQIDSILQFVGFEKVSLKGNKLVKQDKRSQLDFSSIAKGMACDEIAQMLRRGGATSVMVEIGGEVTCFGKNDRGEGWVVSVDMPMEQAEGEDTKHEAAAVVVLDNGGAVATSGSYRKWKESGGKKLSHIIDPKTGSADESNLVSVTIIAENCMLADAWATACMAMGVEKTQKLFENDQKIGVMTIHIDNQGRLVVWTNKPFTAHQRL